MPLFIKTEVFKDKALKLTSNERKHFLAMHRSWISKLNSSGISISSGYLIDASQKPGGGGLLVIEAECYQSAKKIIENDPLIISGLVNWSLHEWVPVSPQLLTINEDC